MLGANGVELDVLACGDHELMIGVAQRDVANRQVLRSREPTARDLQAHHVAFFLLVDAEMLETLRVILAESCLIPCKCPADLAS
jgi:hypothetical protein